LYHTTSPPSPFCTTSGLVLVRPPPPPPPPHARRPFRHFRNRVLLMEQGYFGQSVLAHATCAHDKQLRWEGMLKELLLRSTSHLEVVTWPSVCVRLRGCVAPPQAALRPSPPSPPLHLPHRAAWGPFFGVVCVCRGLGGVWNMGWGYKG
jgi:hypothetical protein